MKWIFLVLLVTMIHMLACTQEKTNEETDIEEIESTEEDGAKIISVNALGTDGNFTFSVKVKSPDTGCDQYANWWEIITEDGQLIYRRILGHSHVDEQPFERSGGKVNITKVQIVIVRAHMNNIGYGTSSYKGSVAEGFKGEILPSDFAGDIETEEPQPGDCPF